MTDPQYLEIILQGWREDIGGNLTNHLYREWKKAEKNHYTITEFFAGLKKVQKWLAKIIDDQVTSRKNEVDIIRGLWESEGKDLKELEGQEDLKFSINAWHITRNDKYLGITLWQPDIDYIGMQIALTFERLYKEIGLYAYKDFSELFQDAISFGDLPAPINTTQKLIQQSLHDYQFTTFLKKIKETGENDYEKHLTRNSFKEYLDHLSKHSILQVETIDDSASSKEPKWTALTFLLCKYFENGCTPPNETQIESMVTPGVKKNTLKNKHRDLKSQEYNHTGKKLSIKAFSDSYNILMAHFKKTNPKAFVEVEKKNKILKETYASMLV